MQEHTTHPFIGPCEVCGSEFKNDRAVSAHLGRNHDPDHKALQLRHKAWRAEQNAAQTAAVVSRVPTTVQPVVGGYAPFLGPCEVCGKVNHNYNALGLHLSERHNPDEAHRAFKARWHAWRAEYRATLRCRKCGDLFEITDKRLKDSKRCPRCEHLRQTMSKRKYEALRFDKTPDPRTHSKCGNSKARCPVGYKPEIDPTEHLQTATDIIANGGGVRDLMVTGLDYTTARALAVQVLGGEDEYDQWVLERKTETVHKNREQARLGSGLEELFVEQMRERGIEPCGRNEWMTVPIDGKGVHREADIKIAMGSGRKAIVLCDGVAFHGPGCVYGDPDEKMAGDIATAEAMFHMGYTVLRYSGDEIKDGSAIDHLGSVLSSGEHVCRHWFVTPGKLSIAPIRHRSPLETAHVPHTS